MTFLELREMVWYWLDDLQGDYFTEVQVNRWLNNAQKEVQKILVQAGENWYLKCAETTTFTNQCDYFVPNGFMVLNRLEIVQSGVPPYENVYQVIPATLNQKDILPRGIGTPQWYTLLQQRIKLFPTPDLDSYKLRLEYTYRVTDMINDTDIPDVPEEYHEALAIWAAYDGFIKDDRVPSNLLEKRAYYLELFKQAADNRNVDVPRSIVVTDVPGDWSNW